MDIAGNTLTQVVDLLFYRLSEKKKKQKKKKRWMVSG